MKKIEKILKNQFFFPKPTTKNFISVGQYIEELFLNGLKVILQLCILAALFNIPLGINTLFLNGVAENEAFFAISTAWILLVCGYGLISFLYLIHQNFNYNLPKVFKYLRYKKYRDLYQLEIKEIKKQQRQDTIKNAIYNQGLNDKSYNTNFEIYKRFEDKLVEIELKRKMQVNTIQIHDEINFIRKQFSDFVNNQYGR